MVGVVEGSGDNGSFVVSRWFCVSSSIFRIVSSSPFELLNTVVCHLKHLVRSKGISSFRYTCQVSTPVRLLLYRHLLGSLEKKVKIIHDVGLNDDTSVNKYH